MSSVKAKLKIVLHADKVVVAESEDPVLWQRILSAIHAPGNKASGVDLQAPDVKVAESSVTPGSFGNAGDAASKFSQMIGVSLDVVQGACSPSAEAPYLQLDMHCWEVMKKQTPARGPGSIPPIAIAATLLALWFRAAGDLGNATQAQAQRVLGTLGIRDANAVRGLMSTPWVQVRSGGVVIINPAQMSKAIAVARAFCSQQWKTDS